MQQRYYDPVAGRFLSVDPVEANASTGASFNRYWYGNNNPYRFIDPDGRDSAMFYTNAQYQMAQPVMTPDAAGLILDFTPVVGDVKGFYDAYQDPTPLNITAAVVGLVPVIGDVAGKVIKNADVLADAAGLGKKMASEQQLGEIASGAGVAISGAGTDTALRQADRLASDHGGNAADWSKVTSTSYTAPDGQKIQTHAYENSATGQVVESKTKLD